MRSARADRCRYLVCGSPRTGSTLVCAALRATGLAGSPKEPFDPRHLAARGWLDDPPEQVVARILDETASPNGVSGQKMLWTHWVRLASPQSPDSVSPDQLRSLAERLPTLRYIWITRRDGVKQAVSYARALQTDRWVHGDAGRAIEPRFIWDEVDRLRRRLRDYDRQWGLYFSVAGIEPLEIVYEDLVADYEKGMRRVFGFLGIDPAEVPPPPIQPQADRLSAEWVDRYTHPTLGDRAETWMRRLHRGLGLTRLRDYLVERRLWTEPR